LKLASLRPHLTLWGLRGAWALAVGLWALALVPWFRTPSLAPVERPRATAPGAAAMLASSGRVPDEEVIEPAEPAPGALQPRSASAVDAIALPVGRGVRDGAVCDMPDGVDAPSSAQRAGYVARQAGLGLLRAFESLRARAEIPAQAAGWWLRVVMAREGASDSPPAPTACAPGTDCVAAAAPLPPVAAAVDALAQLAQASSDPWVQQIAQRACDGATAALPACTSLGARRWSTLEPDNAAAWLELAARDAQAIDEALFRAAQSSRYDDHRGRLAAWVLQATPEQSPAMQRYAAWQRSDELERASEARVSAAVASGCNDAARRDANREQLCDGAARWLAQGAHPPASAEAPTAASAAAVVAASRALDCASIERQWREARDAAQRGHRVAVQATAAARP
jgi:hypothetical protein